MTKRKLKNTKEIYFTYIPGNNKNIIILKDNNPVGKKYTEKEAYDLIQTIFLDYTNISCNFEPKAEEQIRDYAKSKNKSEEPISRLKKSRLEILKS